MKLDIFMAGLLVAFCGAILLLKGQDIQPLTGDVTIGYLSTPTKRAEDIPLEIDIIFETSKGSILVHKDGRVDFPEGMTREQSAYIMAQCMMAQIKYENERYDGLDRAYDKLLTQYEDYVNGTVRGLKAIGDALNGKGKKK